MNKPNEQSLHQRTSEHGFSGEFPVSKGVALGCGGGPDGTHLQEKTTTQTIVAQVVMEDLTSFDGGTDSCPYPIGSSAAKVSPETAIELVTVVPLEQLAIDDEYKEGSNVGTCELITKVDCRSSHFASGAHMLFFVVFATWIVVGHAVLYKLTSTAIC